MSNTISRDSLVKTLEDRYKSQPAGGAFNAKNIQTNAGSVVSTDPGSFNLNDTLYRKGGFIVKETQVGYKGIEGNEYNSNSSLLSRGLNNKRYK
jgi:hypothetical protein